MNLRVYIENLQRQLAVAAEAGGEDARALAERLVAPLDAAIRLTLQDVLAAAAEEITTELAPGSVGLLIKAPKGGGSTASAAAASRSTCRSTCRRVRTCEATRGGGAALQRKPRQCRYTTGVGDIQLDQVGPVQLKTGGGDISVVRAAGDAELIAGSGTVRIDSIDGTAVVRNSNGDTWIGKVTGDLRVNAANGKIWVDQAQATVAAKNANGDIRLGQVARGAVLAQTGLRQGRDRDPGRCPRLAGPHHPPRQRRQRPGPGRGSRPGRGRGRVRARTSFGDISIHRAVADDTREDEA